MKSLLERSAPETDAIDTEDLAKATRRMVTDELDLHELARRCRVLLAQRATGKFPPGNWLG